MSNIPKSRALIRLDTAIAAARTSVESGCLKAERAGLLARLGRFDESRQALMEVRAQHEHTPSAALAAWVCLAEGMLEHIRGMAAQGRDRIRRAYALSVASRVRPLIAISAAWLAVTDYAYGDLPGIARHATESLQEAAPDDHPARARACRVVGQSYHWGGRLDIAQPWYERARQYAVAEGDESTLSALINNRAWIGGCQARMASIFGANFAGENPGTVRMALMSAESGGHFDAYVAGASLRSMSRLMHAMLLLAQGNHAQALAEFEMYLPDAMKDGMAYMNPVLYADIAWCKCQLGRRDAALADARLAETSFGPDCEEEDRAAAHGRLAQVFAALGLDEDAKVHAELAATDLKILRERQAKIVELLDAALQQVTGLD
jgi:tetratricopeptide (TPR) repeat protein